MTNLGRFAVIGGVSTLIFSLLSGSERIFTVDRLTQASDVVIVGEVVQVSNVNEKYEHVDSRMVRIVEKIGEIAVTERIKGDVSSGNVRVHATDTYDPAGGVPPAMPPPDHRCRIVFLKKSASDFEFTAQFRATLPAVCGASAEGDTYLEKVIHQLLTVLKDHESSANDKLIALGSLQGVSDPRIGPELKDISENGDPVLHIQLLSERLRRNDVAALGEAVRLLANRSASGAPSFLMPNLDYAIRDGIRSKEAVHWLIPMMHSRFVDDRRAAAAALRNIASPDSVEPLKRGLFDTDVDVQYYSLLGLANFTPDREWVPNAEVFRAEHTKYIKHWREWASRTAR